MRKHKKKNTLTHIKDKSQVQLHTNEDQDYVLKINYKKVL